MMLPTGEEAINILNEGYDRNPGPWREHSLTTAICACRIAERCPRMDGEKAYILGLLHDIGRRFGRGHLRHVLDGYRFCMELGYQEAARICLTHSFAEKDLQTYIGEFDVSDAEQQEIVRLLDGYEYDDYDRLIQVCDSIAMPEGPVEMEKRMQDVKDRYGEYPESKWNKHLELKRYFEEKAGAGIYEMVNCYISHIE